MNTSLKWNGTGDMKRALRKGANTEDIKTIVRLSATQMQQQALRDVPVRYGTLKQSLILVFEDGGYTAKLVTSLEYSVYVEYGTRFMSAQPYMTPAFTYHSKQLIDNLSRIMR